MLLGSFDHLITDLYLCMYTIAVSAKHIKAVRSACIPGLTTENNTTRLTICLCFVCLLDIISWCVPLLIVLAFSCCKRCESP